MSRNLPFKRCLAATLFLALSFSLCAQRKSLTDDQRSQRLHLILKDGTFQIVLSYNVDGNVVHYRSAERNGEVEDIPLDLVDLPATEKWKSDHIAAQSPTRPVLSPELEKEEAERRSLSPEIAPDLHLPEEDSVLALDTFHGAPELEPIAQNGSDLNRETAHAALKSVINPASLAHQILTLSGPACDIQLHTQSPVFYVRIGDDDQETTGGQALTVDTHGASGRATPGGGPADSRYVIERLGVRGDMRIVNSFRIGQLSTGRQQPDIIETRREVLPGAHWMKLTPEQPLEPDEYALIEVLSDQALNLNVWDFGVHPNAKDNFEAIRPEPQKARTLERRAPE